VSNTSAVTPLAAERPLGK